MNTDLMSRARRSSIAKLLWAGSAVVALSLTSIALFVPHASGVDRAAVTPHTAATPSAAPAVIESNRIDHSQIDWDKVPTNPEAVGTSIAAYGAGA